MHVREPTLADLMITFWRARLYALCGGLIGALVVGLIAFFVPPHYRATMIVAPADGYALGDYASNVAEGASLEIPFWRPKDQEGVSTDYYRFIYTLKGSSVAAILIKDPNISAGVQKDMSAPLNAARMAEYLDRHIRVEHLGTTALRRIRYDHPDPVFAAEMLRKIHLVADQLIRRDRKRHADSRIEYLKDTLARAVNPDHRRGITQLLLQQENIRMLANLDEAYAAIIVEPAAVSPRPVWPNLILLIPFGILVGLFAGYLIYALRHRNAE